MNDQENFAAFNEGRKAFHEGAGVRDFPPTLSHMERYAWQTGFSQAAQDQRNADRRNVLAWLAENVPGIRLSYEGVDALATLLIMNSDYQRTDPIPLQFGPVKLLCPSPLALETLLMLRDMLKMQPELFIEYDADLGDLGTQSSVSVYWFPDDRDNPPLNITDKVADVLSLPMAHGGDDAAMTVPSEGGTGIDAAMTRLYSLLGLPSDLNTIRLRDVSPLGDKGHKTMKQAATFSPRTGVTRLYPNFLDAKSVDIDWSEAFSNYMEGIGPSVEYYAAAICDECGMIVNTNGQPMTHDEADRHSTCEGALEECLPVMNYGYPISTYKIGSANEAARALADLPVVLVEYDDALYLALTGGGMNMSWELCEAFMRLGYLPPVEFCDLPDFAGHSLTTRRRWVLAGARRSLQIQVNALKSRQATLRRTAANMRKTAQAR